MTVAHDFAMLSIERIKSPIQDQAATGRYAMDGARGLASLKIMLAHTLYIGEHWSDRNQWWVKFSPIELILDMRVAVYLFYVLSGYVLYSVLERAGRFSIRKFIAHRLARIGLPLVAVCLIAYMLVCVCRSVHRHEPAYFVKIDQDWLATSMKDMLGAIFLVGDAHSLRLDPPLWSLVYELRASLMFPFFFAVFKRQPKFVSMIVIISSVLAAVVLTERKGSFASTDNAFDAALFSLFLFLPFFVGACLCRYRKTMVSIFAPRPWSTLVLLAPLYVAFRTLRLTVGLADLLRIVFAAMALICVIHVAPVRKIMEAKILRFFGSISYSLYLTHFLVLYVLVALMSAYMAPPYLAMASVCGSLVVAVLFYRWIERPAHLWAKTIGWR